MPLPVLRRFVVASFVALIALGTAWELWLAPLRPGAWLLSLKVVPLVLALPALAQGRVRAFQWWSMLVLVYLAEGLVRMTSDRGASAVLAGVETALAALAFALILRYVHVARQPDRATLAAPDPARGDPPRPAGPDR